MTGAPARPDTRGTALRLLGVLAVAAVLRPPIATVGPVLGEVQDDLGLPAAAVSLLTALPVLCFGAGAFVGPALARRLGTDRALAAVLGLVLVASAVRVLGGTGVLFAGTVAAGAGIAVANVLLPALVKQDFPHRVGGVTGLYTATLSGSAALAALVAVPLADATGLGWRGALGAWAAVTAVALAAWLPQVAGRDGHPAPPRPPSPARALLRNRRALALTAFMGLQSLGFYSVLTWLPSLLVDAGSSPFEAGALLSLSTAVGVGAALVTPAVAARLPDQRPAVAVTTALAGAGLVGLLVAPATGTVLWVVLLGVGQGGAFPLALLLVVLRSSGTAVTGQLSAMSQGFGYLLAAAGPFVVGALQEATGGWSVPLLVLLAALAAQTATGWSSGRPGHAA